MITDFLNLSKDNNKIAIIDMRHKVSFNSFLNDCLRMKTYFEKEIPQNEKVLVFVYPYSYLFYVAMFAGIMAGVNLVILDSFKDKDRNKRLIESVSCQFVIVDKLTRLTKFKLPKMHAILINRFKNYCLSDSICREGSITTFTSGSTGDPKPIKRSIDFLFKQASFIRKNVYLKDEDILYCGLPMYTMLSIYLGHTTIITKKIVENPTVLLTSIRKILQFKRKISIKRCFLGGAILYKDEANHIASILSNADITYIYGATESALMYKTSLANYIKEPFSFKDKVIGADISIVNPNFEGVGEIAVSGEIVIGEETHYTGDIGIIKEETLYVLGRKKYSNLEKGLYNYQIDNEIRWSNKKVTEVFSFFMDNKMHIVYTGKMNRRYERYVYHKFNKLYYDAKHKTKLDYAKMLDKINNLN